MTSPYQIVQLVSLGAELDRALARQYAVLPCFQDGDPSARLDQAPDARVMITSARCGLRREWLEKLPALAAVCSSGVGYDSLDLHATNERGILVSNTPDVLDGCVADMAWALMLSVARRVVEGDRYVRADRWAPGATAFPLGTRVWGKRLGVLGLGRIGAAIARRASGFDMQVRYYNRRERADTPYVYEPSLIELARWSDYLVVACPGGAATHHLVDREVLDALGSKSILVNIARGSVIDEEALVAALQDGSLGGAGLDVFADEPNVPRALYDMDHVTLMPHVSSATHDTRRDMGQLVLDNVDAFFKSGQLLTPVG